ncbi:hypothetical protein FP026_04350 [Rhizobium tropici]|uniref:Uncharacterized protein n=1 Tax=Rhizobium tropici TaxID=398 RepID=A0A5B0WCH3_RHITR|nr:hypothetical protein [Rhizobium tropici]KAA1184613.1 hypothetical protein FP026_04350 [Rhizobium tropici]
MTATKDVFFKPAKISAQAKADLTTSAARNILAAEEAARHKKTEKLRALRLAQPVVEAAKQKKMKKSK